MEVQSPKPIRINADDDHVFAPCTTYNDLQKIAARLLKMTTGDNYNLSINETNTIAIIGNLNVYDSEENLSELLSFYI